MTDFDFDEIDRAVNSLNDTTSTVNNDNSEPVERPVVGPSTDSTGTNPVLAGRRSSGQFMDVVHPSSDMRRAPLMMPERESRPNINPSIKPEDVNNSDAPELPVLQPSQDMPMTNLTDSSKSNEDADIDQISDEINNELNGKSGDTLDSPFLSDAKVEKRPLGAFSGDSSAETSEQPENNIQPEPVIFNTDAKSNSPLPDELQDDLLKVESDVSINSESKEIIEKIDEDDGGTPPPAAEPTVSESAPVEPVTAPVSIVQQYKEQPSSSDQNSGAIYDTNSYHKGLVAPVKKKSGWLWVLWIVLLIALGAGAGAAIYFFVIPML